MSESAVDRVAEALALHRQFGFGCTGCDWISSDLTARAKDDHRRHQAAAVLAALDAGADAQAAVERATALADEWERRAAEERSSDPAAVEQLCGAARSLRRALAGDHAGSETGGGK